MAPERRKLLLLALLLVVLVAAVVVTYRGETGAATSAGTTAAGGSQSSNVKGQGRRAQTITAPNVHLDSLSAERPRPDDADRNLFRFQPKAPPPRPAQPVRPAEPPPAPVRQGPPPPPTVPPIALKLVAVGVIQKANGETKIASLNDGRGVVLGTEGEVVLGRYKIWKIGDESIDVSYADGTGRTTIRLSGQ